MIGSLLGSLCLQLIKCLVLIPPIYKLGVIVAVGVKGMFVAHGSFSNCMIL